MTNDPNTERPPTEAVFRQARAMMLLQMFESGKIVEMVNDHIVMGQYEGFGFDKVAFQDDVEGNLKFE